METLLNRSSPLAQSMNHGLELGHALMQVLQKALAAVSGVRGSVVLMAPLQEELVLLAKIDPDGAWPPPPDQKVRRKFQVGEGIAGLVAETGQAYYAPIISQDPHFIPPTTRPIGDWSLLAVPMMSQQEGKPRIQGVISLEGPDNEPDFFDDHALHVVSALATEAVTSIEEATWPALIQSTLSYYRLRHIQAVSQVLASQKTLQQILEQIARIVFEELQADLLTLYPWDVAKQDFITPPINLGHFFVPAAMGSPIHKGDVVDRVFHEWGSQYFSQAATDAKLRSLGRVPSRDGQPERERFPIREKVVSVAILRLEIGAKRVGVLCVNWRRTLMFDEAERAVLEIFANHVAIAIENARLMRLAVGEATAAQRERLHRDLHDWIGGSLTAISHLSAACRSHLEQGNQAEAVAYFDHFEQMASNALRGVRVLLADLRPLTLINLKVALHQLCSEQRTPRCAITPSLTGSINQLREGIPQHVYRIAREAILNAKHHGQASSIQVTLTVTREILTLDIQDNGKGGVLLSPDARRDKQKYGLSIMEQLAFILGAQLAVEPNANSAGWHVSLQINSPLRSVSH